MKRAGTHLIERSTVSQWKILSLFDFQNIIFEFHDASMFFFGIIQY